ncbi:F-box/LRR-repeat protein 25-like [Lycium ferocissimum]|uniref:F-box/LRR-repeat protein 25-like n=1 Tax=Lycium ferocissimum TaxID=112874 RepID=UPI00281670BC|nr:F-box/LRR-repeat protein 25-like [Lycium ferocissimum]
MDETDRISELPETMLQHIMSFLDVKDVRMGTLSKSKIWNSAWNSLSYLNFGDKFFPNSRSEDSPNLANVVDQTLASRQKHKISVQKFWILLPYRPKHKISYVDDWIRTLVACNIKELNLRVSRPIYGGKHDYNELPDGIFNAKALNVLNSNGLLNVLNSNGFKIKFPSNGVIMFSSLREFHLCDAFLDEEFIQALCTSCCNLEVLSLQCFDGLASFQVGETSLSKLKKVNLEFFPSKLQLVDIAATNLEDLKISSHGNLKVVKITAFKALKSLFLDGMAVMENWLEELFYSLQNLEKFQLFW